MKSFNSLQDFIEITKEAQKHGYKNLNCYLMPNEIIKLIGKNALSYIFNENTLQIIIKADRFIKVCFYANDFVFTPFESNLPIIVDIPYSGKMNERMLDFKQKLLSQGFCLNSETTRMSLSNFDKMPINVEGFAIEKLNAHDIDEVYQIWEENFDAVEDLLYSKEEIKTCENKIFVLKDKENNIVGAVEIVINGMYGWVQKIAVKKFHKGKGFGGILERFYINTCKSLGIKTLLLYTINSNLNAQQFHKKFGFMPDGKYNCQFIYRR